MITHQWDKLHGAVRACVCPTASTNGPMGGIARAVPAPSPTGHRGRGWWAQARLPRRCKRQKRWSSPSTSFPAPSSSQICLFPPLLPVMMKFCSHNNKSSAAGIPGREKWGKKGAKANMSDGKRGEKIPLPPLAFSAGFTCIILFPFPLPRLFDFCIIYGLSSGPVFAVIVSFNNKID